jgi:hypothetical protein
MKEKLIQETDINVKERKITMLISMYIEYYRKYTILFLEIKTNDLFTGGLD